jgi:hypothetical protein
MSCANIKDNNIKLYNNTDPRYNFTIKDSDEFNTDILPLFLKKTCKNKKEQEKIHTEYPMITRCWGQRYENCIEPDMTTRMDKYGFNIVDNIDNDNSKNNKVCASCEFNTYDNVDHEISWINDNVFTPRKINNKVFYDMPYVSKITHPIYDINLSEQNRPTKGTRKICTYPFECIEGFGNKNHCYNNSPNPYNNKDRRSVSTGTKLASHLFTRIDVSPDRR